MNYLAQYVIPFSGLKEGKHLFEFTADDRFFAEFEESEFKKGEVEIEVELEKRATYLKLKFQLKGAVETTCDRCLELYLQPIKNSFPLLVKFSEEEMDDGDEMIYLHPSKHQLEVAHLIYEYVALSVPIKRVHPTVGGKSQCDPEMLNRLAELKGSDPVEEEPIDPRWNDLKKFIGN